jgi:hypothetical protein
LELKFDKVWADLLELANSKDSISTLSQHVDNEIWVTAKGIRVMSERPLNRKQGRPRLLRKERVRLFWSVLEQKGNLIRDDILWSKRVGVGRIIFSLLAHLPYIEYETKPQRLYLMPKHTHKLGTLRIRGS